MLDDDTLALDLDDSRQAGVFFVTEDDLTALAALAQDAELLLCRLDLRDCDSHTELMARLQAALALPDPAPRWETLGDLLRDLGWLPAPGYVLLFSHAADLRDADETSFDTLLDLLDLACVDWQDRGIPFWAFLALPDSDFPSLDTLDLPPDP